MKNIFKILLLILATALISACSNNSNNNEMVGITSNKITGIDLKSYLNVHPKHLNEVKAEWVKKHK